MRGDTSQMPALTSCPLRPSLTSHFILLMHHCITEFISAISTLRMKPWSPILYFTKLIYQEPRPLSGSISAVDSFQWTSWKHFLCITSETAWMDFLIALYSVLMKNDIFFIFVNIFIVGVSTRPAQCWLLQLYWYLIDIRVGERIEYKVWNYLQSF